MSVYLLKSHPFLMGILILRFSLLQKSEFFLEISDLSLVGGNKAFLFFLVFLFFLGEFLNNTFQVENVVGF